MPLERLYLARYVGVDGTLRPGAESGRPGGLRAPFGNWHAAIDKHAEWYYNEFVEKRFSKRVWALRNRPKTLAANEKERPMLVAGSHSPLGLLQDELIHLEYEGYRVPERAREALAAMHPLYDAFNEAKLLRVTAVLEALVRDPAFPYVQPNELAAIRAERPPGPRKLQLELGDDELLDRFHGAWTGRAAGCALGRPVETLGKRGHRGLNGRLAIKQDLQARQQWELDFYFSGAPRPEGPQLGCPQLWREHIAYMEPDDDIHYTLIGLKVLEAKGAAFQWYDVAQTWNASLPYSAICTAEQQAILNYNLATPRNMYGTRWPVTTTPEFTRRFNNPYREWIGAQIRADGWAYGCAGNPERAAEFAWRDAHWTHTANGIYGEMFMAAMVAAAFVEHDPLRLVEIGLSEIPRRCRLAEDLRWALATMPAQPSWESFMEQAEARFEGMNPTHTVNNAIIVVMALYYGGMDPDRTICLAVMGGLDTDCNGATVGSIVGAAAGRAAFGGRLAAPLHDTIKPEVFGFQQITMTELAQRTLTVCRNLAAATGSES